MEWYSTIAVYFRMTLLLKGNWDILFFDQEQFRF